MPIIEQKVETAVNRSFRVEQVVGMFDIVLKGKLSEEFAAEVPDTSEDWQIGAIIGPSGSGKTTIARAAFGTEDLFEFFLSPYDKMPGSERLYRLAMDLVELAQKTTGSAHTACFDETPF